MTYCKICNSNAVHVIYRGRIRNGGLGKYTDKIQEMFQCQKCDVIWHDNYLPNMEEYYESAAYRDELEGTTEINDFYKFHDCENADKIKYTGTTIFRNKNVMDIGCGGGAFLDMVSGCSNNVIAIEPSVYYRNCLKEKGYYVYPYSSEAIKEWHGKVDVITSFDVIEHVDSPSNFLSDIESLLSDDGLAIIGTPTDAPVMRELLGKIYEERLLFSTQHLWIFNEKNLKILTEENNLIIKKVANFQRYGLSNLLAWLKFNEPKGHIRYDFVTQTMDNVYRSELEKEGLGDYIVIYLQKKKK